MSRQEAEFAGRWSQDVQPTYIARRALEELLEVGNKINCYLD